MTGFPRSPSSAAYRSRRSTSTARASLPALRSADAATPHDVLLWQLEGSWAVRSGDWKLLHDPLDTTRRAPGERLRGDFLYNLREDPSESTSLAAAHPELVERLTRLHVGSKP